MVRLAAARRSEEKISLNHKAAQFKHNLKNSLLRAIFEEKERPDAQEAQKNAVRQTGKCRSELIRFEVGIYSKTGYQKQLNLQKNALNAKGACKAYEDKDRFDNKSQVDKDADRNY